MIVRKIFMPNASELQRLTEELDYWKQFLAPRFSKQRKEMALRHIRSIETQLGIPHKPYNGMMDEGYSVENER